MPAVIQEEELMVMRAAQLFGFKYYDQGESLPTQVITFVEANKNCTAQAIIDANLITEVEIQQIREQ